MRHVAALCGWVLILAAVCQAQDVSVTSTAIAQVEKPNDLITVSHETVEPGQLFFIKIKSGVTYKLSPDPKFLTSTTDDKTGDKVLIVTAGDEPITVSAETTEVRISEQELKAAPSFIDPEGYSRWMSEHKVPVHDSRTVSIDHGLSEFAKSVRSLARKLDDPDEVRTVSRNFGVIASAIEAGDYGRSTRMKIPIEGVYLLNSGSVGDENARQWNTFFKGLSKLETYQDIQEVDDVRSVFRQIQQGLEASLE